MCSHSKGTDFLAHVNDEPVAERHNDAGSSTPLGSGIMGGRIPGVPLRGEPRLGCGTALRCEAGMRLVVWYDHPLKAAGDYGTPQRDQATRLNSADTRGTARRDRVTCYGSLYSVLMKKLTGTEGTYELRDQIGTGGNGEVWRAAGPRGDVAIKLLKKPKKSPPDAGPRFDRELLALRALREVRGVLPLLDSRRSDDTSDPAWFAMPIATPLRHRITSTSSLTEVCCAFAAFAGTLATLHARNTVHRDIKPDNLYWHDGVWCLGDFGLVDFHGAEPLTADEKKLGPVYYIAPEMLNTPSSADGKAADIFSLAKTLWVVASGQNYPLPGVHDPSMPGAELGAYRHDKRTVLLDELLRRMTLSAPAKRPTASEVAGELNVLCTDLPPLAIPDTEEAMADLRAALVKHNVFKDEESRNRTLAEEALSRVRAAVTSIAHSIESATGLHPNPWYDIPQHWGFRTHIGSARVTWNTEDGFSFEAGGSTFKWRLSLGLKGQVLSNGRLFVQVGYQFDHLVNDSVSNELGVLRGWTQHDDAPNGNPSSDVMIENMISFMHNRLPEALKLFAERVAAAVR